MSLFAPLPHGKRPVKVEDGGTGGMTVPEAQDALRVPGLDTDNVFTGDNVFEGTTETAALNVVDADLTVPVGSILATGDPSTFSGIQVSAGGSITIDGNAVITEAPQDGGYYVRRNGAWVDVTTELGL